MNPLGYVALVITFLIVKIQVIVNAINRFFKERLYTLLPRIIKRQVLIITLYLKGRNERVFEDLKMPELNQRLMLANDPLVLEYLVSFNRKCDWYSFDFQNLISKHSCDLDAKVDGALVVALSRDIVGKVPSWLTYGTETDMIQDISCLLMKIPATKCEC